MALCLDEPLAVLLKPARACLGKLLLPSNIIF